MMMMSIVVFFLHVVLILGSRQFLVADAFVVSASTSSSASSSLLSRGGTSSANGISRSSSSSDLPYGPPTPTKVLVTGASGRTGQLVFTALLDDPRFEPVALVRSERSAKKLLQAVCSGGGGDGSSGTNNKKKRGLFQRQPPSSQQSQQQPRRYCGLDQIVVCDVTKLPRSTMSSSSSNDATSTSATTTSATTTNNNNHKNDLAAAAASLALLSSSSSSLQDCTAMIICTSAVPVLRKRSLLNIFLHIPKNFIQRNKKLLDFSLLRFGWKQGQYPELVDYYGTVAQIDWAKNDDYYKDDGGGDEHQSQAKPKRNRISHIVMVSSMGGTDPSNFLNRVGKNTDGTGNGDILLWKRKAERYLVQSGLDYTIIHPGGLIDTPAGVEEIILDVDDILLQQTKRSISRADVANLCVAALVVGKNKRVSFDCITQPIPAATTRTTTTRTTTMSDKKDESAATVAATTAVPPTATPKTAEQVLATFLETRKTANYDL